MKSLCDTLQLCSQMNNQNFTGGIYSWISEQRIMPIEFFIKITKYFTYISTFTSIASDKPHWTSAH